MTKTTKLPKTSAPQTRASRKATPTLRFSPTAWAKLQYLRDYGDTEVGGFGIAAADDLLLIEDVQLVRQACSWAHVAFDDEAVADYFDQQVDAGRRPEEFARVWLHTHPGDCPLPSGTDEQTFGRVFGRSNWALMFILAREGQSYARLRFNVGPQSDLELPVDVEYACDFGACDRSAWEQEYLECVQPQQPTRVAHTALESALVSPFEEEAIGEWYENWLEYVEEDDFTRGFK